MKILVVLCLLLMAGCSWLTSEDDEVVSEATAKKEIINEYIPSRLQRKILVLKVRNRSALTSEEITRRAETDIRNRVLSLNKTVAVSEEEIRMPESMRVGPGLYDLKSLIPFARSIGISGVIQGTIEDIQLMEAGDDVGLLRTRKYTTSARVHMELYDTSTASLVFSKFGNAEIEEERTDLLNGREPAGLDPTWGKEAVAKAIERALATMPTFAARLSWVGRIARVDPPRFYINGGEATGLRRGQLLQVFSEGQPVTDSKTGASLGLAPGRHKGLLKIVDFFGEDAAIAVVHSGAGFKEQDPVELYNPPLN